MLNTDQLIKDATIDIMTVVTVWGLLSNSNINTPWDNNIYSVSSIYKTVIGLGISTYLIGRYL